ncbi:MAG: tetratricopeptide repeat protein [Bacteroidota bacterium]|nr:MAG: tetratricopeptide repeat protein [Bacteroidota bacterium]
MAKELDYTQFIERYLQQEMSPAEKVWFEKELQGNSLLQDELLFYRKVNQVLAEKELVDFKLQLDAIHREIIQTSVGGQHYIRQYRKKINLLAGSVMAASVVLSLYFPNRKISDQNLYNRYFEPASFSVSYRDASEQDRMLKEAMQLYESKQYSEAISHFEKIMIIEPNKYGINLYAGIAHMELAQYPQAILRFNTILTQDYGPFSESASWYLGLCYLYSNEKTKAKNLFEGLMQSDGYYKRDAHRILKHMKGK